MFGIQTIQHDERVYSTALLANLQRPNEMESEVPQTYTRLLLVRESHSGPSIEFGPASPMAFRQLSVRTRTR